jgi:hypothetical protein
MRWARHGARAHGWRSPVWLAYALACAVAFICERGHAHAQEAEEEKAQLGARARTEAPPEPQQIAGPREVLTLRATHGESFALIESMPGAVPVFSGVPYLLIRGAPPGGSTELYDGAPVPAFHHVALGPAIAHPLLVSRVRFHPGVAPARYGRGIGAVVAMDAPDVAPEVSDGELALNAIDSHALVRTSGERWFAAHGRIGYPSLWLDAIDAGVQLGYGDYQARLVSPLGQGSLGSLHVFGAYDQLGTAGEPQDDIELSFHRLVMRLTHVTGDTTLGTSVYAGHDRGSLGQELRGSTTRFGPAIYAEQAIDLDTRVRIGADMEAKLVSLERLEPKPEPEIERPGGGIDPNDFLPEAQDRSFLSSGPELFVDRSPLRDRPTRNAAGVFAEVELLRTQPVRLELGLRSDVWLLPGRREVSADPRAIVRVLPSEWLELHAGAGTAHQSAASPLPIPGIADVELDTGLQRAIQAELGARLHRGGFELSATGFYHRFDDMVFLELVLDCEGNTDPAVHDPRLPDFNPMFQSICRKPGLPRGNGAAYGVELLASSPRDERVSGFVTYTLAYADGEAEDGTRFTPQFDVRHLINLVLGLQLGQGFSAGARVHFRTGKSAVNTFFDFVQGRFQREELRLPAFFRTDVHVSYRFATSLAPMTVTAGVQNVTFSREATKRDCQLTPSLEVTCEIDYQPAIVLPNVGLRVEL